MSSSKIRPVMNRYYDQDYFTATQCSIYIGDVWVDEITSISWTTRQSKTPLYGYASQLMDTAAAGQVLVQGSFTINYKEQAYLWLVLRRWFGMSVGTTGMGEELDPKKAAAFTNLTADKLGESPYGTGGIPIVGPNKTRVSRAGIERLLQGKASKKERWKFYHSLAGYASRTGKDKTFEDLSKIYEDQLWKTTDNDLLLQQLRRTDDNVFDGFDIYFVAGNFANPRANHTAQKIAGVRLLDQGKVIAVGDGQPLQEAYGFIAKTVF